MGIVNKEKNNKQYILWLIDALKVFRDFYAVMCISKAIDWTLLFKSNARKRKEFKWPPVIINKIPFHLKMASTLK